MKHTILCIDDETDNVEALERLFRSKFNVLKATSGAEGLALLKKNQVALIISDQRMPQMTGVEFFKKSKAISPDTVRILLTGYTDIESVVGAINAGEIYRYVTKPWDSVDLVNTVEKGVEKYLLTEELKQKNQELQKAYDELRVLDDSKNHFMILINHELKTPLTVILSFLELLQETNLNDEQKKYIEKINLSSQKLKKIIDDVLALVSAETGTMKLAKKSITLKKFVDKIKENFNDQLTKKDQSLSINISDTSVKADEKVLTLCLQRIIENAIKFSKEGTEIVIEENPLDKKSVEIAVINEGKAMSSALIDKILKPFTIDENIMNHSQGTGLGLSLCQALLKHHASQLSISSPKNQVRVAFTLEKS